MEDKFTEEEIKDAEEHCKNISGYYKESDIFLAGIKYQKRMGIKQIKNAYDAGWDDGRTEKFYGGLKYICKVSDDFWKAHPNG